MKIIYIVFNNQLCIQQAYSSIVSCLHFHPEKKDDIILFTDEDVSYINLPIQIKSISGLKLPTQHTDHILVKRIQIIKWCIQKFKDDVLYIDADTMFFKPLGFDDIPTWQSFVHMYESPVRSYKWWAFSKAFDITYWKYTKKIWETDMYNASVLWISKSHIELLDEIHDMTDIIFKITGEWTADQVAFSYFLSASTNISYVFDRVFHYWAYKEHTTHYIYNSLGWTFDYNISSKLFEEFISHFAFWCLQFLEKTGDHVIDYFMSKPEEYERLQKLMSDRLY